MSLIDNMRSHVFSRVLTDQPRRRAAWIDQLWRAADEVHAPCPGPGPRTRTHDTAHETRHMATVRATVGDLTALAYALRRARYAREPSPGLHALAMIGKTVAMACAAYAYHLHVRPPGIDAYRAPTDFDRATVDAFSARWKGGAWRQVHEAGVQLAREIGRAPFDAAWTAECARRAAVWSASLRARVDASDAQRRERERWSNAVQPDDAEAYDVGAKDVP